MTLSFFGISWNKSDRKKRELDNTAEVSGLQKTKGYIECMFNPLLSPIRVTSIKFLLVISMLCIKNKVVMIITAMITQDEFA